MGLADKLGMAGKTISIDWDITPSETFGIFESWGGKFRVRSRNERYYYFYINNWEPPAKLYLMERGIKHAKILARFDAPQEMLERCVSGQGKGLLDKNYAIDESIKKWIVDKVFEGEDLSGIEVLADTEKKESLETDLPARQGSVAPGKTLALRSGGAFLSEEQAQEVSRTFNFYDSQYNPTGSFGGMLVDNRDKLTVTDLKTEVMWQRGGCDLTTIRNGLKYVEELNRKNFAGFSDWRLPTMEEALSLMEAAVNGKDIHLHPCFSKEQPFIFLSDQRKPGGYWFADFKQGTVFWASGSIPGGFGRVCRNV